MKTIRLNPLYRHMFAMATSSTKLNSAGVAHAHSLVDAGKVNKGSWSFSADDGNKLLGSGGDDWTAYGKWFLATHPDQTENTKAHYGYPFGKDGEVYRNALISAKGRATQEGATDVADACSSLLDKIDGKESNARAHIRPTFFAKVNNTSGEIYLYDDIGDGYFGGVSANSVAEALRTMGNVDTVNVYVNSAGGSVFDGLAIYNQLKRMKGKKIMHVDGVAASIASVICMAGDEIRMAPNSQMMIHDPWGMAVGTADDMRKNADALDQVAGTLVDTYAARTKGDKTQIQQWMKDETWMTADMCLARGFCDVIDADEQTMNAVTSPLLAKFKNTPEHMLTIARSSKAMLARMGMRVLKNKPRPAEVK